jgi:hypothetical protein
MAFLIIAAFILRLYSAPIDGAAPEDFWMNYVQT